MRLKPPVIITAIISSLFVIGVLIAPENKQEPERIVAMPLSTYQTLSLIGAEQADNAQNELSEADVIQFLIAQQKNRDICQVPGPAQE